MAPNCLFLQNTMGRYVEIHARPQRARSGRLRSFRCRFGRQPNWRIALPRPNLVVVPQGDGTFASSPQNLGLVPYFIAGVVKLGIRQRGLHLFPRFPFFPSKRQLLLSRMYLDITGVPMVHTHSKPH